MDAKSIWNGITRPVAPVAIAAKLLDPGINAILPENDNQQPQPLFVTARRPEEYEDHSPEQIMVAPPEEHRVEKAAVPPGSVPSLDFMDSRNSMYIPVL